MATVYLSHTDDIGLLLSHMYDLAPHLYGMATVYLSHTDDIDLLLSHM